MIMGNIIQSLKKERTKNGSRKKGRTKGKERLGEKI